MDDENVEVQGQCNAETVKVTGVETDEKQQVNWRESAVLKQTWSPVLKRTKQQEVKWSGLPSSRIKSLLRSINLFFFQGIIERGMTQC